MRYAVCVDFETTCFDGHGLQPGFDGSPPPEVVPCGPEIIEVGMVVFDLQTKRTLRRYQARVRPGCNWQLSEFCKRLLHVSQEEIDSAAEFTDVWPLLMRAIVSANTTLDDYMVFTCGPQDLSVFLPNQWRLAGRGPLPPLWTRFVDIQMMFWAWTGQHGVGLYKMLRALGISSRGLRRHSALGDAFAVQRFLAAVPDDFLHELASVSVTALDRIPAIELQPPERPELGAFSSREAFGLQHAPEQKQSEKHKHE